MALVYTIAIGYSDSMDSIGVLANDSFMSQYPVPQSQDTIKMFAGFFYRLTHHQELNVINRCMRNATDVTMNVNRVVNDIYNQENFDIESIMIDVLAIVVEIDQRLMNCVEIRDEIIKINNWISQFENTQNMLELMATNIQSNYQTIFAHCSLLNGYLKMADWERVGESLADIL